jgi:hypothetical protein
MAVTAENFSQESLTKYSLRILDENAFNPKKIEIFCEETECANQIFYFYFPIFAKNLLKGEHDFE